MSWSAAAAAAAAAVVCLSLLAAAGPARISEPLYQREFTRVNLQRAARRSESRLPPAPARPRSVDFSSGAGGRYDSDSEYDSEAALGWFPYLVLAVFVACAGCLVSYVSVRVAGCVRARRRSGAAGRRRILRDHESELFDSLASEPRSESAESRSESTESESRSPTDSIEPRSPVTSDSAESRSSAGRDPAESESPTARDSIESQTPSGRDSLESRSPSGPDPVQTR
ncbi:hypothetical protein FJT64_001387 [Amphibalanus amphitrite]|uniref:Uncharacterized protein n=1 Tax=Amphibalanus amphitrite TaxID=1232801 RepID=A0A6A4VEM5_AMPAM|nr:hypothetical protein FJT64_001387 [Amphibalanus amphitrite]